RSVKHVCNIVRTYSPLLCDYRSRPGIVKPGMCENLRDVVFSFVGYLVVRSPTSNPFIDVARTPVVRCECVVPVAILVEHLTEITLAAYLVLLLVCGIDTKVCCCCC